MHQANRSESAARLLSTTGAALAGVGLGALFANELRPFGAAVLVIGLIAHVVGMVGNRQAQEAAGYHRRRWEVITYWLCWVLIAALVLYLGGKVLGLF